MSDTAVPSPITRLYRACEPLESLRPDDPRWVDFDSVRGDDNVVALYERSLKRALSDCPEFKLFAGHRGVGKTSELYRLKQKLETPAEESQGFIVVMCEAARHLDVNDLDFPDLLVLIAGQLQEQLKAIGLPGFEPVTTRLNRVWDDLCSLFTSDVEIAKREFAWGLAVAAEIRNRPNARRGLREAIEIHRTSLLGAVNDLLDVARVTAISNGYSGLVLIIDGLDKLVFRLLEGGGNTDSRLFIDRSEQLASLRVHTVYTVPISLIYSAQFGQLQQSAGEHNSPISMIRLRSGRDDDIDHNSPGMQKLREMVEKRCRHANVELRDVFDDDETLDRLCRFSGGHPRHLMMFLQSACNELDDLPITRATADKAIRKYANALAREVPDEAWDALRNFRAPQGSIPKNDLHQLMLNLLFVFEYMNGEPWYEVNPVLATVERFSSE